MLIKYCLDDQISNLGVCDAGVAPPSFVAIQAGTTLQRLTSSGDAVSWMSVGVLAVLAVLSLLPTFFKRQLAKKLD